MELALLDDTEKKQPRSTVDIGSWEALKILSSKVSFWVIVFNFLCGTLSFVSFFFCLFVLLCAHLWLLVGNWGFYIFLMWLPTYANSALGFNLQISGIIAITPIISCTIVSFFAGKICDMMLVC